MEWAGIEIRKVPKVAGLYSEKILERSCMKDSLLLKTSAGAEGLEGAAHAPAGRTRALWSAVIGNILEWYDFAVYGFVALAIAKAFFPAENQTASLLATFAVFGIGFVVRPLGAIIIGRLGDVYGRKVALLLSLSLMALGSLLIGGDMACRLPCSGVSRP